MLYNYFKIAWRNLKQNRVYSFINITGMAIGLAACMLIITYILHESGYDSFHDNAKNIYWIQGKIKMGTDSINIGSMSFATAPLAKDRESTIESFLRYKQQGGNTVVQNPEVPSRKFTEDNFFFADSNFFSFFSFRLTKGNKNNVLSNPFAVVISQKAADKYFGDQDPVGKQITYNNDYTFTITGIAENAPSNSSIGFDFIASLSSLGSVKEEKALTSSQTVENGSFKTYFALKPGAQISSLENTLGQLFEATAGNNEEDHKTSFHAIPLEDTHLKANYGDYASIKYLKIFPFVATLVLLLALINYISLSTARSSSRAKEIGVRKVMGAYRKSIALQFFVESAICTSIAFILAYIICSTLQPAFFSFLEINVDASFLQNPGILLNFSALFILTVILSATYPSIILSAFKPAAVLYGRFSKKSGGLSVRRFLTVFQFTISVILIFCGIVINNQIRYIKYADTGVQKDNIVMIPFSPEIGKHYHSFTQEIQAIPAIQAVATSQTALYKGNDMMGVKSKNSDKMIFLPILTVDKNFMSVLGLQWKQPPADSLYHTRQNMAVVNETAVKNLNLGDQPVDQKIDDQFTVAGVLKDFNYYSLQNEISALALLIDNNPDSVSRWAKRGGCLFVKINAHSNIPTVLDRLKNSFEKYDRVKPFEYAFLDDAYNNLYKAEDRLSRLLLAFTSMAIMIACLGLLGLTTFMAMQRSKEIGIRKVLGASVQQIAVLVSGDFLKLVLVATVLAFPVAGYIMTQWLQDFAYRINISWWIFLIAGAVAVLIAIITISFQSIKIAVANPVTALRSE